MKIGFTGTRKGMTEAQVDGLRAVLPVNQGEFHHGDCIGADARAHDVARAMGMKIVCHPPVNGAARAFKFADEERSPRPYLRRNRNICLEVGKLIAAPAGFAEEKRSGTWSTIRFAKRIGLPVIVVWPDGSFAWLNRKEPRPGT